MIRIRPVARLLTLSTLMLVLAAGALAQPSAASQSVEARVDTLMSAYDHVSSPGASVLVFRGEETLFSRGYGMANLEYDVPITSETVFHVASVSKQFTAFALAMLEAQGRLSLDDEVQTHLTELPDFGEPITLRHLLNHTSGLRDQWNLWVLAGGRMDDVIRQDDLHRLVTRQRELNFSPGAEYLYSNSGYMLAAKVVERVTGQSFGEWMQVNVFEPLGMNRTQVYDDHERIVPGRAYSYRQVGEGEYRKAVLSYANSGATSLFTTTEDLAKWLRNYGNGQLGGPAVGERMVTRGILADGDTISYALGVFVDEHRGLEMIQHGGADAGYRSYVAYFPALDAGVVVLSNLASFNPGGMAREIADVFFDEYLTPAEDATSGEGVRVAQAVLDRYTGLWSVDGAAMQLTVDREGSTLFGDVPAVGRVELTARTDSTFRTREGFEITFHRRSGGVVQTGTVALPDGSRMSLSRADMTPASPEALSIFAGRYYSPELETFYTLEVVDDVLIARHRRHGDIRLMPGRNGGFIGDQWFFGDVSFERDAEGSITAMNVSSGRVRDLAFQKLD
jgi:CubicO group peptidase (beta-lactamase class C family)